MDVSYEGSKLARVKVKSPDEVSLLQQRDEQSRGFAP